MTESKYIVLDTETGGFDCKLNPITEVALSVLDPYTLKEIDSFQCYVKPYNDLKIEDGALKASLVSIADIKRDGKDALKVKNLLKAIFEKHAIPSKRKEMGKPILVAQNGEFDLGFLEYLFVNVGPKDDLYNYLQRFYNDTWNDSKRIFGVEKGIKHNLSEIARKTNTELKSAHGAMNDVKATAEVFRKITFAMRRAFSEESEGISENNQTQKKLKRKRDFFEF